MNLFWMHDYSISNQIIYFLKRKQKFKNRIDAQFFGGTRVIFLNIRLWTKAPTSALQGGSYACCRNTLWGQLKAFPSNSSFLPQIPFFLHMKCRCSWWQAWSSLWVLSWALCGHYIYHTYTQKNFVLLFQLDCPMCADFFDGFTWFHTATWLRRKADIR